MIYINDLDNTDIIIYNKIRILFMNILSKAKQLYLNNVSNITFFTTGLSLVNSVFGEITSPTYVPPNIHFRNIIGMTTIGVVTGVTFPISFPLMGICMISSNANHEKRCGSKVN
uniref:Uncharacterized protein n=1 Tax=viral metagenome TaxID=1070528 RepID=A0A6C0E1U0_9ZZZZ